MSGYTHVSFLLSITTPSCSCLSFWILWKGYTAFSLHTRILSATVHGKLFCTRWMPQFTKLQLTSGTIPSIAQNYLLPADLLFLAFSTDCTDFIPWHQNAGAPSVESIFCSPSHNAANTFHSNTVNWGISVSTAICDTAHYNQIQDLAPIGVKFSVTSDSICSFICKSFNTIQQKNNKRSAKKIALSVIL